MNRLGKTAVFVAALICAPAITNAQNQHSWVSNFNPPSAVTLHEPVVANAIATITFRNEYQHKGNEDFELILNDMVIFVRLEWNVTQFGAERITIITPPGLIAVPNELTVDEQHSGQAHIFAWEGM